MNLQNKQKKVTNATKYFKIYAKTSELVILFDSPQNYPY